MKIKIFPSLWGMSSHYFLDGVTPKRNISGFLISFKEDYVKNGHMASRSIGNFWSCEAGPASVEEIIKWWLGLVENGERFRWSIHPMTLGEYMDETWKSDREVALELLDICIDADNRTDIYMSDLHGAEI